MILSIAGTSKGLRAQSVRAVRSSLKVRPTDVPSGNSSIELHAAENEFEAFQVVVSGGASGIGSVTVVPPTLQIRGSGTSIPPSEVRYYLEKTVTFSCPANLSSPEGACGEWRDALVPNAEDGPAIMNGGTWDDVVQNEPRNAFPIANIPANRNEVVFVEIHVPASQPPGTYTGMLTIDSGGAPLGSIAITLVVRPFAVPSTSSLPTAFQTSSDQICAAHGDAAGGFCVDETRRQRWNRLYARFMLDHRVSISLAETTNSSTAFDTIYKDVINGADNFSHRRMPDAQMTTIQYPWATNNDALLTNWVNYARPLTGRPFSWIARSFAYAKPNADEPGTDCSKWQGAFADGNFIHSNSRTDLRTVVTTGDYSHFVSCGGVQATNQGSINILSPVLDFVDVKGGSFAAASPGPGLSPQNHRPDYATFIALNPAINTMWMYQSCDSHACGSSDNTVMVNYPSFMVDATGVENRAEPWMHYIYDVRGGMLYYETVNKLSTAWQNDGIFAFGGQGDGTLLYPGTPATILGTTHIPLASYRLKMLRDGLEDYEYLLKCDAKCPTAAKTIALSLFPMTGTGADGQPSGSMFDANNYPVATPSSVAAQVDQLESTRDKLAACITCSGCMDSSASCQPGNTVSSCGSQGAACSACPTRSSCTNGACTPCSGCMDSSATCQPGNTVSSCGSQGAACSACPAAYSCTNGACTCSGCIDASGTCQPGNTASMCGTGGGACNSCPGIANGTATCSNGACGFVCNGPQYIMCNGQCIDGSTSANCGACGFRCPRGEVCALQPDGASYDCSCFSGSTCL